MEQVDKLIENFDVVESKVNASKLANVITDCMISNGMTLENLNKAMELVKEVYKKNAIIKKVDPKADLEN